MEGRADSEKGDQQDQFRGAWRRNRAAPRRGARVSLLLLFVLLVLLTLTFARPVLGAPNFQLTISPSSQRLQPGSSVSFAIGVGSVEGFSAPVDLSVSGLPSGVTAEFLPDPVTPPATSFLKLTAAPDASVGTFSLTITATGGGITQVATGSATVDFGLVPVCYGRVQGVVTDAETGLPIPGAGIKLGPGSPETTTDETGSYGLDQVPLGENNSAIETNVIAQLDEPVGSHIGTYWHAAKPAVVVCHEPDSEPTRIDLALVPVHPSSVSGKIVEGIPDPSDYSHVIPTSTPIEGARPVVVFFAPEVPFTTGQDGRYDLSFHLGYNNAPFSPFLQVDVPDLPHRHGYWDRSRSLGEIGPDQHLLQEDFALVKQCTASLSGNVSYGDTLLPAVNVGVQALNAGVTDFAATQTDAQGAFSIPELLLNRNNEPTTFNVFAQAPGYDGAQEVSGRVGCGERAEVTLVLQPSAKPRFGAVEGHVYDEETGAPVAGVNVGLRFNCECEDVTTDAAGHYRIDHVFVGISDADVGRYSAVTSHPDYWQLFQPGIEVRAGQSTLADLRILNQRYGRMVGIVRNAITHEKIAGANGFGPVGVTTDENGRYDTGPRFPLRDRNAPNDVQYRFEANGYWFKDISATIRADETTQQDVDLLPICQGATISGKVVDAVTQLPIEGASVGGGGAFATTDATGDYRLQNVTVGYGNSPLEVAVSAGAIGYHRQTKTITIFCGGAIVLDFGRVPTQFGAVEGYVTDNVTGNPMPDIFIGSEFGAATRTDASGYYKFSNVPLNPDGSDRSWAITAMPESFSAQTKSVTVHANTTSRLDFDFGAVPPGGHIVVKKRTEPAGDLSTFTFTGDAAGTIGDGQTISIAVNPGIYHSTEQVPPDWVLQSISCDDSDSAADKATATFQVAAGETVSCTFVNAKRGTIVIKKETRPADDRSMFAFGGDASGTIGNGGAISVASLPPGDYRSSESVPVGWDLTRIGCDDGHSARPSTGELVSATARFRLDPGETVACTFTNTKRGLARVVKTVSGRAPGASESFTFELRQGASTTNPGTILDSKSATVGNGGVIDFTSTLTPGTTYALCEAVMPGWTTTLGPPFYVVYNPSGDNSTVCTDFTVAPGETKSFAIDNRPPPGGLARTIGFWKNWASCTSGKQRPVLDQTLAAADPAGIATGTLTLHGGDCLKGVRLLDKSTIDKGRKMASDPAFGLAAQLLAAKLNIVAGAGSCPAAVTAINDGQTLLAAVHFNGISHDKLTAVQVTRANTLASTLDRYNNNLLC